VIDAATLPSALREQARVRAQEPWLFHRPAWTWQWRSYGQVADQVARGAEALREAGAGGRHGCLPLVAPDAVAAAVVRALSDDRMVDAAVEVNRRLAFERVDDARVRPRVLEAYRRVAGG